MSDHVLIRLAHRFPVTPVEPIAGWRYRRDIGAWVDSDAPDSLYADWVALREMSPSGSQQHQQVGPHAPTSKKADIETGEDMKGE